MKHLLLVLLSFTVLFSTPLIFSAQETATEESAAPRYVRIVLQNGGVYEGEVISIDESDFLIKTIMLGNMRIAKMNIASIVDVQKDQMGLMNVNTRSTDINPQAGRYFFAPSAFQLEKGDGYYHNALVIYNQVSYGFTDYFTAGISMTPLGAGATIKLGTKISDKVHVSVGGIGLLPFYEVLSPMGIAFVNITVGDERRNLTLSLGNAFYNYIDDQMNIVHQASYTDSQGEYHPSDPSLGYDNYHIDFNGNVHWMFDERWEEIKVNESSPLISLAGMLEINSNTWIMSENYFVFGSEDNHLSIISMGVRRASKKRDLLWDYSLIAIPSEEIAGIPWVSLTVPF